MRAVLVAFFLLLSFPVAAFQQHIRESLPANTTFYVTQAGSDSTGDGLSLVTAWRTPNHAVRQVQRKYDLNCFQATVQIEPGAYPGFEMYGPMIGCQSQGGGPIIVSGNCSYGAGEIVINGVGNAISIDGYAAVTLKCLTVNAPNGSALYATNGGVIEFGSIIFGTARSQVHADAGGVIFGTGSYTIAQGADVHLHANEGGFVKLVPGITITVLPGLHYAVAFAFARGAGRISMPDPSTIFSSSPVSGAKCFASILGIVDASGNAPAIPGQQLCGSNYGGQYY